MVLDLRGLSRYAPTFADCMQPCMVHFAHKEEHDSIATLIRRVLPAYEDKQNKTLRMYSITSPASRKCPDRRSREACLALLLKSKKTLIGGCKGQDGVTLFFP